MKPRMDAAVPLDAQNAPTGTWKTAQTAVSHSAHTHHRLVKEGRSTRATTSTGLTHEIPDTPVQPRRIRPRRFRTPDGPESGGSHQDTSGEQTLSVLGKRATRCRPNLEHRTQTREPEPNLKMNTNREARSEKCERQVQFASTYRFTPTGQVTPVPPSPQYPSGFLWRYCW
jgi:hypothetical protein